MIDQTEIYRAIGELAYVIAKADDGLHIEEKRKFLEIIEEELKYDAWAAESRFELLDEKIHPTLEHAYNEAIHEFKIHKDVLTPALKEITIRVVKAVASSYHSTEVKDFIIDRLEKDLKSI